MIQIVNVEGEDAMVRGMRLHPVVANHDRHGAPTGRLLMDHPQFRINPLEACDFIQPARDRVDEHSAAVAQHARLVRSLVGREPDCLDQ